MSHELIFVEIEGQYVEMLPSRTLLTLIDIADFGPGQGIDGRPGTSVAHHVDGKVYQYPEGIHD